MTSRLEAKKVSKAYERGEAAFVAVDRVDLSVEQGEFVSVMGRSGSGKSTLLNLAAGLLLPSAGEVLIDGTNAALMDDSRSSLFRARAVGHIPQGFSLLQCLNVLDNARLPFFLAKRKGNATEEARRLLSFLGIESLENCYPAALSGGEAKRAAAARALINKPLLLLADEPTENLDAESARKILSLLKRAAGEGTAVVMATHDQRAADAADTKYEMEAGRLFRR